MKPICNAAQPPNLPPGGFPACNRSQQHPSQAKLELADWPCLRAVCIAKAARYVQPVSQCFLPAILLLSTLATHAAVSGPPYVTSVTPAPGVIRDPGQIVFIFNEAVTNFVHNDLAIDNIGALPTPFGSSNVWGYRLPSLPPGPHIIRLSGIQDFDSTPSTITTTNWNYTVVDDLASRVTNTFPHSGTTLRSLSQFEVFFDEPVRGLDAADLLVNGLPSTNLVVYPAGHCVFQFAPPVTGQVHITWAASPGMTDYAVPANVFPATNVWSFQLDTNLAYADLAITEICAANRTGLRDEDGLAADWVEIYNRSGTPVNLAEWSLSDDETDPGKWVFPSRVLSPGERLVVFASGKDIKSPTGTNKFHLNFTLSGGGEYLGLFPPESPRTMQGGFAPTFPEQRNDISWGLDASGAWRYFTTPTPGSANPASAITNFCEPVHFSVERGHFTQPFDLVLTTPTPGATIRYTTDGSEPGAASGLIYSAPLRVSANMFLRAAAFRSGFAPSKVRTHSYLFNQSAAVRALPVLSIVTDTNHLYGPLGLNGVSVANYPYDSVWQPVTTNDYNNHLQHGIEWERPVSAELIRPEDNGGFQIDCGMRIHGSPHTRPRYTASSKYSYRLYFRGDYGEAKLRYPLFPTSPVQEFDVIVLRAGKNDQTNPFIKDELGRRLQLDTGTQTAQGTFVNLFVNGVYRGYYNPTERMGEDSYRAWDGGSAYDEIGINSQPDSGDRAAWDDLRSFFLYGADLTQPSNFLAVAERLDLTNLVDFLLVEVWAVNTDWPQNNWYAARARQTGAQFRFYGWDFELCYANANTNDNVFTQSSSGLAGPTELAQFFQGLVTNREFRLLWADRVQRHFFNGGALTDANITARFEAMRVELAGVIASMNTGILTTFMPNRRPEMFKQMASLGLYASNAPAFNQHGGPVSRGFLLTMTAPMGGTVYCTLDGSDPRVPFTGTVATNAFAYTNAIPLITSAVAKARVLNGTNWSPLAEAVFQVARLGVPVSVTEINYNPPGGNAFEFIELLNTGPVALDLTGMHFDAGITYNFPQGSSLASGASIVLANNADPAAFEARYPGTSVFGWFAGNLSNAGERLTLRDAGGNVVFTVDYDDAGGWPLEPDGDGASLEIIDPLGNPDDPANWQSSAVFFGTPGSITAPPSVPTLRLNELAAAGTNDWVELFNAGSTDADISNWSLTDDGNARKFAFPTNTLLPAGGYLLVWCDTNSIEPGLHSGFALGANSDNLYLFNAQTQRVDAISFGPQIAGFTLGRIDAEWQLCVPTTNSTNTAASLASLTNVVINEWLANPPSGLPDWLELHNRGGLPVALRGCYLANSNAVQPITTHTFVAPGGYVQLFADEDVGLDHLDLKLTAAGDTIALYDPLANQLDRVVFTAQTEGVTRGRYPNGSAAFTNFFGTASPGASNYVDTWTGPIFSEILARRVAFTNSEFVELFNPAATNFNLAGCSISVDRPQPGQWVFPPGTVMAPGSYLILWATTNAPASTNLGNFNLGEAIEADSGGAYLFNPVGQLVEFIEFGPQAADLTIGLNSNQWRLLSVPTPGMTNTGPQALGTNSLLRINEWMAASTNGPDWFEIYNPTNRPIELSGLYLTDDPSTLGLTKYRIAPLSFIGASNWVRFVADNDPEQGRDHVNFSFDSEGEGLWLVRTNGTNFTLLDAVSFGAQVGEVSQGRWLDGASLVVSFPGSVSPRAANYLIGPPQVIVPPTNVAARVGSNAVFTVVAAGALPLGYQWYFNGATLTNATNASYTRTNMQIAYEGMYEVVITNPAGSNSASAVLSVALPPSILQGPVSMTVAPGERVTLSVAISGYPPPFTYEWRLVTTPIWTNTTGETTDFFTFAAPLSPGQQNYRVVVKNPSNTAGVGSAFATITVGADFDGDGLPDSWETTYGFPTNSNANLFHDSDGDGVSNFDEYLSGTNPTNPASLLRLDTIAFTTNAVLGFTAAPSRTYSVLWREQVGSGDWLRMLDLPASPTQRFHSVTVPAPASSNQFFRLVTPRWSTP